jgi:uncharacterized protein YbaR (Trm112 family)
VCLIGHASGCTKTVGNFLNAFVICGNNESLLKLLVCPQSKAPLKQVEDELICEQSELAYPIIDGIPVLLVEEARKIN